MGLTSAADWGALVWGSRALGSHFAWASQLSLKPLGVTAPPQQTDSPRESIVCSFNKYRVPTLIRVLRIQK